MNVTRPDVLQALRRLSEAGQSEMSSTEVISATGGSSATVRRHLDALCASGELVRDGKARATRYRLAKSAAVATSIAPQTHSETDTLGHPAWSPGALQLRRRLDVPLGARDPVTYQRDFIDSYVPNTTWLMPQSLADELYRTGRMRDQQPAGTYARKVLEQLLIDLSWSSSKLEGNRYTLLDTEELFKSGQPATDFDGIMLLNHKAAIEFLVDSVPTLGLNTGLLQNMHAVLMRDLLPDPRSLGAIRTKLVNISGTAYVPTQVPQVLREIFELIVSKAQHIKNPVEAAFFLWVNLAYLQPFEDGNKRVSRLAANIPLMLYNQAPLSFLDVDRQEYALAMMGVYEFCDVSMAADLFAWTYRRSQAKYRVILEAMGAPDPFRLAHREVLNAAILLIVRERKSTPDALQALALPEADADRFGKMLEAELEALEDYNSARYRLRPGETADWIQAGRPH